MKYIKMIWELFYFKKKGKFLKSRAYYKSKIYFVF